MKTIKLGLIGLGGMGSHHAPILQKLDGVEITGVCDLIEEKAKKNGRSAWRALASGLPSAA